MQFGGILLGKHFDDREIWDRFHCLDVTKRNVVREQLLVHWPRRGSYSAKRLENWHYLEYLFRLLGMKPVGMQREDATPTVFLLQCDELYAARRIAQRLEVFGVQAEFDEAEQVVALPCHAGLSKGQLDYIFGAFRGMVNPCHAFRRKAPVGEA